MANGAELLVHLRDEDLAMTTVEDLNVALEAIRTNQEHIRLAVDQLVTASGSREAAMSRLRERVLVLEQEQLANAKAEVVLALANEKLAAIEARAAWFAALEKWGLRIGAIMGAAAGGTQLFGG